MATSMVNTAVARVAYSHTIEALRGKQKAARVGFPLRHTTSRVRASTVNPSIRKDEQKVVDSVEVEELAKPLTAYCRCWRSGTFPLCDGSHVKHNKETGDNVGPLLLKKPKA